jgi:hypothetical protein
LHFFIYLQILAEKQLENPGNVTIDEHAGIALLDHPFACGEMGLSKKLFSVIARRSLAKQSPQTNVDCDPSTLLRVTRSSFWPTPNESRESSKGKKESS